MNKLQTIKNMIVLSIAVEINLKKKDFFSTLSASLGALCVIINVGETNKIYKE